VTGFSRIVVAVDGSANAGRALELAGRLASASGASVAVVHAVGLLEERTLHAAGAGGGSDAVDRRVFEWCEPLRSAGVDHHAEVVAGSPVPVLLAAVAREGADLVVVGSRGLGGPGRRLGSTSLGLVEECPVPVLVVPPPG